MSLIEVPKLEGATLRQASAPPNFKKDLNKAIEQAESQIKPEETKIDSESAFAELER